MLSVNPGQIINELKSVVVIGIGAVRAVANTAVVDERDIGNAPGNGRAAFEVRNAQRADNVRLEGKKSAD